MVIQTDFLMAVNQISAERNIDPEDVFDAIKQAIRASFKTYSDEETGSNLHIEINKDDGGIVVFADKKVVKEVTDSATQISLKDAKKYESKLKEGDHVEIDITPEGEFGRVAAQAAKQVILQKIREAEKESILKDFTDRIGELETGIVQRLDGDGVLWEVRKATALMPLEERINNEYYKSGSKHKVLIKTIEQTSKGKQLIVSRSDPDFLRALFELEVPELVSGSIEIKAIAREAGSRSKVAVTSNSEGVDPIGSCVGQKGVRINVIMNELKISGSEEKIDIILWDEDYKDFIANSLSPAEVVKVDIIDEKEGIVKVIVPDEQLSLAIGKEGQNVRLAAKLTGWKIDIQGETIKIDNDLNEEKSKSKKGTNKKDANSVNPEFISLGLSKRILSALAKEKVVDIESLSSKIEKKEKIPGIGPKAIDEIIKALK